MAFGKGCHLHLVDGSAYIFRAYHALPPLTRKSDGLPIGAVAGFCNMLFKQVEDNKGEDAPTHVAVIFDYSGKSFRNEMYPAYKANRPPAPEDLVPQFPLTRDATRAFNIASIEKEGFEADDIIATYARQAREAGGRVTIISSDKDLMQLVGGGRSRASGSTAKASRRNSASARNGWSMCRRWRVMRWTTCPARRGSESRSRRC
jgi:DNA polymerase-1